MGSSKKQSRHANIDSLDSAMILLESLVDSTVTIDEAGNILSFNPAAENLFGYSKDEVIGKNVKLLMPEPYRSEHDQYLANYHATGKRKIIGIGREVVAMRKDGSTFPIYLSVSEISSGSSPVFVGIVRDITERKRDEEALLFTQFTLDNAADCIYWIRPDARLAYVNRSACKFLGYSNEELLSKTIIDVNPEYTDEVWRKRWRKTVEKGANFYETQHQTKSGQVIPVEVWANHIRFAGKEYSCTIVRDISERKRYEKELAAKEEAAEAANIAKSRFLARMSHELRTPLNAIIGYSEMLLEDARDIEHDTFSKDLSKIRGAGKHLLGLIGNILDLSRIESDKLELTIETAPVSELIDTVEATVQPLVDKNANQMVIRKGDDLGEMQTDPVKVRQILFNLISNAAKFTERGSITLEAHREKINDMDWLVFSVTDTGVGIGEEQLQTIFTEFAQADTSITRQHDGAGLGLTISRMICRMLNGEISTRSEPGKGSTFTVRLPARFIHNQ